MQGGDLISIAYCHFFIFFLFISRDWGYCLDDEPGEHLYNFPVLPAGTMYDADHQCRLQYGTDETEICTDKEVNTISLCLSASILLPL